MIECRYPRGSGIEMHDQFATRMQSISAEKFLGQRLQLIAQLKTEDADRGSIWMRVDHAPGKVASFDDLYDWKHEGVLEGTVGWTTRSIVLQIPQDASSISFGFVWSGTGVFQRGAPHWVCPGRTEAKARDPFVAGRPSDLIACVKDLSVALWRFSSGSMRMTTLPTCVVPAR